VIATLIIATLDTPSTIEKLGYFPVIALDFFCCPELMPQFSRRKGA
jgi:hypothetical protein